MEGKISLEELKASMEYINNFEKGCEYGEPVTGTAPGFDEGEKTNGEISKLKEKHKQGLAKSVKQAKFHKECLNRMEKGEDMSDLNDPSEDEVTKAMSDEHKEEPFSGNEAGEKEVVEKEKVIKKGLNDVAQFEELIKSAVTTALSTQQKLHDKETGILVKGFEDRLKVLEDQPQQKSLLKGAQGVALEKAFQDVKASGKKPLFVNVQKDQVSDALYKAFTEEKDPIIKGEIGESITTLESASYISPSVLAYMSEHGIVIM